jgi:hypothetical protein
MDESVRGFTEGQAIWVEDGDEEMHPAIFVGETESASWFGGVPQAHVVHAETREPEVVPLPRITPRDAAG